MNKEFKDAAAAAKNSLGNLMKVKPVTINGKLPNNIPEKGIYLFSNDEGHLYVGRTNRIRARLLEHSHNSHQSASFAFRIAREVTGEKKASYKVKGSRAKLLKKPKFRKEFDKARKEIRDMKIRYIEEDCPIRQALLEIYVHLELKTKHNDFDNH